MKNWKNSIVLALTMCLTFYNLALNAQNWSWNGIKGEGPKVTKTLEVADFKGFTVSIGADVYLKQGSKQSVTIEAQQNIIDNIVTNVENQEWKIKFDKPVRNHEGIKIHITIPTLNKAYVSGSGDIKGETKFSGLEGLVVGISGSGDISMEVEAKAIESKISGSGSIRLSGSADSNNINISGSGDILADNLNTKKCTVRVSGSGDCKVSADETLDVQVSGSGDVFYKGSPKVKAKVSGSGNVESM